MSKTLTHYSLMLEDENVMRFVKVEADTPVNALLEAIKQSGVLNPLKVLRLNTNGNPERLAF